MGSPFACVWSTRSRASNRGTNCTRRIGCGEARPDGVVGEATDAPATPTSVIVWMVDTLRADHLGCYGYERPTSPHIDALAADGVLFEQVHAQARQRSVAGVNSQAAQQ